MNLLKRASFNQIIIIYLIKYIYFTNKKSQGYSRYVCYYIFLDRIYIFVLIRIYLLDFKLTNPNLNKQKDLLTKKKNEFTDKFY